MSTPLTHVSDIVSAGYIFRVLVSQEFSYSSACERLAGLDLDKHTGATVSSSHDSPTINSNSEPHNIKLLRCGSFVHLDSHASVRHLRWPSFRVYRLPIVHRLAALVPYWAIYIDVARSVFYQTVRVPNSSSMSSL